MTIWLVEPRDPLLVRDGRPFGSDPGARATSLPFPFPSTLAGGARTRSALDEQGAFKYDPKDEQTRKALENLKQIAIRGPLLVQLTDEDAIEKYEREDGSKGADAWLVPIPGDVQFFDSDSRDSDTREKKALLRRLVPLVLPAGAQLDFGREELEKDLLLVGLPFADLPRQRKPLSHKLRYWYWEHFQSWLINPTQLIQKGALLLSTLGLEDIIREQRMHVNIDYEKDTGKEGLLYGTSGLEFTAPGRGEERLRKARRLALAIEVEDETLSPQAGVASFGAERRLVTWRKSDAHFPSCPPEVKNSIKDTGHCRLVLLTPGYFEQGYYPTWLKEHAQTYGVTVDVKAIAVRRPQVVSGWDLERGEPKPSRRLAPPGTVLFLSVNGTPDQREQWINDIWMQCISDDKQERRDGFGLAALGTWSGKPVPLEEGK